MRNDKPIFFTVFLAIFLCACDPSTKHRKIIQNDSDYDVVLLLEGQAAAGYKSDSILVGSHSQITIFEISSRERVYEYKNCDIYLDSIRTRIVGNDTLNITMNLRDGSNWEYFLLKETRRKGGECDCRIQIRNEDIQ
ncbi:hypothetical protein [Fluviicola taffensis]|uniref:Lipoprotein n=1 Tax=Fluviicola taffensis (strain DSM 16823 / NCIMB 13979 / RW262) TaxID=755732 RepID=F2IF32_FLUTR|nr:hypothetical protein [Fluviicola taffensis]AEA43506.1 hypothetical protein Fluta_1512 [Fluviicola taffensis DSM 16823]